MRLSTKCWTERVRKSRHEFIAASLSHQDSRRGSILLNFLTQAVNVGFERMRGHAEL